MVNYADMIFAFVISFIFTFATTPLVRRFAYKIGAVDVKDFPKGRYMEEWQFISDDGRFNLTLTPTYDYESQFSIGVAGTHCHQVNGVWNGTVILDDGREIEIKNLHSWCEYVENRW